MTTPKLTPAQQRALGWLPKDGSRRQLMGSDDEPSERTLYRMQCKGWIDRSPQYRFRLSPFGIATFYPEKAT